MEVFEVFLGIYSKFGYIGNLFCYWNKGVFSSGLWIVLGFRADRSDLDIGCCRWKEMGKI